MKLLEEFAKVATTELYHYGEESITVVRLAIAVALLFAFFFVRGMIKRKLEVFFRKGMRDKKQADTLAGIVNIVIGVLILLTGLQMAGIGIRNFVTIFAALGIGIGFGLQNLVNNTMGGIILLFERTIHPGDVVQVNGHFGLVQSIGWRATVLLDWDNIERVIPNSCFIDGPVENWTLTSPVARIGIPFGVSYGSDRKLVHKLCLQCAKENKAVEAVPEPITLFKDFGDSSLDYMLNVWTSTPWRKNVIASEIRERLLDLFEENNVHIPFPQRDVHMIAPKEPKE